MPGALDHHRVAFVHAADADPVDAVGERLEERELLGRERVGHAVQSGAREDLHVLAVAAPEADPTLAGHVAVAVDAERRFARQDLVDADAVTLLHPEARVGRELHDPADDLVPGDDREHARVRDQLDALVGREVAATEPAGFDPEHRAAGRRIGDGELAHFVALVPEEDDGSTGVHGGWSMSGGVRQSGVYLSSPSPGPRSSGVRGPGGVRALTQLCVGSAG